eukprot:PhM_4_TR419/c5_g1_i1/m.23575
MLQCDLISRRLPVRLALLITYIIVSIGVTPWRRRVLSGFEMSRQTGEDVPQPWQRRRRRDGAVPTAVLRLHVAKRFHNAGHDGRNGVVVLLSASVVHRVRRFDTVLIAVDVQERAVDAEETEPIEKVRTLHNQTRRLPLRIARAAHKSHDLLLDPHVVPVVVAARWDNFNGLESRSDGRRRQLRRDTATGALGGLRSSSSIIIIIITIVSVRSHYGGWAVRSIGLMMVMLLLLLMVVVVVRLNSGELRWHPWRWCGSGEHRRLHHVWVRSKVREGCKLMLLLLMMLLLMVGNGRWLLGKPCMVVWVLHHKLRL